MTRKKRAGAGWRPAFLAALAAGKSIAQGAREAGIDPSSVHRVRQRDAGFAEAWRLAQEQGVVRLTQGEATPAPDEVVRGSAKGRPRIQRAGPGRWSAGKEALFLETLAATCNVSAACRATGLSAAAVYTRRAKWPAFADAWRVALDGGYHRLECLLLGTATALLAGEGPKGEGGEPGAFVAPMTVDQAISVFRMHQASVTGEGKRARHDWRRQPASLEEIRREVLRRVRAMGGGAAGDRP